MKKIVLLLFVAFTQLAAFSQVQLSQTEKKIAEALDQNMPYALQLLKESVNINSGTHNLPGVKKSRRFIPERIRCAGLCNRMDFHARVHQASRPSIHACTIQILYLLTIATHKLFRIQT